MERKFWKLSISEKWKCFHLVFPKWNRSQLLQPPRLLSGSQWQSREPPLHHHIMGSLEDPRAPSQAGAPSLCCRVGSLDPENPCWSQGSQLGGRELEALALGGQCEWQGCLRDMDPGIPGSPTAWQGKVAGSKAGFCQNPACVSVEVNWNRNISAKTHFQFNKSAFSDENPFCQKIPNRQCCFSSVLYWFTIK